jgi:hypothetical protein
VAHKEQQDFVAEVKARFLEFFTGKTVLEIGSLNINGTVRTYFENCKYHGLDVVHGPGVDEVCWAHEHDGGPYDVVISCESLEHDPYWRLTLKRMAGLLRPGGLLVITAAGTKRKEHGTRRSSPESSGTARTQYCDHYRNMSALDLEKYLSLSIGWKYEICLGRKNKDMYLWAVKTAT